MKVGDFVLARYPLIDGKGLGIVLDLREAFKFGYDYKVFWSESLKVGWVRGHNLKEIKNLTKPSEHVSG